MFYLKQLKNLDKFKKDLNFFRSFVIYKHEYI